MKCRSEKKLKIACASLDKNKCFNCPLLTKKGCGSITEDENREVVIDNDSLADCDITVVIT